MRCLSWSAWTRISPISGSAGMEREGLRGSLEAQHATVDDSARAVADVERPVERQQLLEARDRARHRLPQRVLGEPPDDEPPERRRQLTEVLDRDPIAPGKRGRDDGIEHF